FRSFSQRNQLPQYKKLVYDLTVSAFSLMELPTKRDRLDVLATLWAKTVRHLVILENGTLAGFRLVQEAREFLLNLKDRHNNPIPAYMLAPCTHDLPCQRLLPVVRNYPCTFPAKYINPVDSGPESAGPQMFPYSYLILSKE